MDSEKWRITECTLRSEVELVPWIARYLSQYGKKISKHTAELIVSRVGFQMDLLSCELDKLLGITGMNVRLLQKKMWR